MKIHMYILSMLCMWYIPICPYVFLWDLDDTLLVFDKNNPRYKHAASFKNLAATSWEVIKNPKLAWDLYALYKNNAGGDAYLEAAQAYGATKLAQSIDDALRSKIVIPGMRPLIQKLHAHGHTHYIGTNRGQLGFGYALDAHPELFQYFVQPITQQMHMYRQTNPNVYKPDPAFFKQWIEKMKQSHSNLQLDDIVFIDDKKRNLKGARKAGIKHAIHFTNLKSLEKKLQKLPHSPFA